MQVLHLSLKDFRNYHDAEISFRPGMNVLLGRNGQGKTNAVEALMYFATLKSHRVAQDQALVRAGAEQAIIRARLEQSGREALLETQINRSSPNKSFINRHPVRARELRQMISAVLFAPEDVNIVRGEPSVRRAFIDDALISRHPVAAGALTDYDRVLRQRNTLLRDARISGSKAGLDAMLHIWDDQLVSLGSQIMAHRRMLVRDIRAPLGERYSALVEADHAPTVVLQESLQTASDVSRETSLGDTEAESVSRETIEADLRRALELVRGREIERGQTLVGPHRDEVVFGLNGLPVKGYASHGETWSYILSLKLALASVLSDDSRVGDPILVLDDVFAELDEGRRVRLYQAISGFEQVIVTAAVPHDLPDLHEWTQFEVHAGRVSGRG